MRCGVNRSSVERAATRLRIPSRKRQQRLGVRNFACNLIGKNPQRRAYIANHFCLREIDLLDSRGLIPNMYNLRTILPMMKGGFSTVSWRSPQ